jgi:hypothetical protein
MTIDPFVARSNVHVGSSEYIQVSAQRQTAETNLSMIASLHLSRAHRLIPILLGVMPMEAARKRRFQVSRECFEARGIWRKRKEKPKL